MLAYPGVARADTVLPDARPVVVATFDTGTNPFHPCFRRDLDDPREIIASYPSGSIPLDLTFASTYAASLAASAHELDDLEPFTLYHVPGTNLAYYGGGDDPSPFVDNYPHGAQASSQIGCDAFGMASNAFLVILDNNAAGGDGGGDYTWVTGWDTMLRWAADQSWIDILHLNIQDYPYPIVDEPTIDYAVSKGKLVVVAAGNGVAGAGANYPTELSRYSGPPGVLVAGASDQEGWTLYSNLDPHVVMDGGDTESAAPYGYGTDTFGGTSSASPRISGYAARLLGAARERLGHTGSGLLRIPTGDPRPSQGPVADGVLSAAELHEVIRKTADPQVHESDYDGEQSVYYVPQPLATPFAVYAKVGYGKVSEHTLGRALNVLEGDEPMPSRPYEDVAYALSEALRAILWG